MSLSLVNIISWWSLIYLIAWILLPQIFQLTRKFPKPLSCIYFLAMTFDLCQNTLTSSLKGIADNIDRSRIQNDTGALEPRWCTSLSLHYLPGAEFCTIPVAHSQDLFFTKTYYPPPWGPWGCCKWICSSAYPRSLSLKSLLARRRVLEINKQVKKLSTTLLCFKALSPTLLYGSSEYICCVSQSEADRMGTEEEQPGPTVTRKAV